MVTEKTLKRKMNYEKSIITIITTSMVKVVSKTLRSTLFDFCYVPTKAIPIKRHKLKTAINLSSHKPQVVKNEDVYNAVWLASNPYFSK